MSRAEPITAEEVVEAMDAGSYVQGADSADVAYLANRVLQRRELAARLAATSKRYPAEHRPPESEWPRMISEAMQTLGDPATELDVLIAAYCSSVGVSLN